MAQTLRHQIFDDIFRLPSDWDTPAAQNLFLTRRYLAGLHASAPRNMKLNYILVRRDGVPVAVAISQFLDMSHVKSFGERDNCIKTKIRTFAFRRFAAHVLLLGNNMLTGQNAYAIMPGIRDEDVVPAFADALDEIAGKLSSMGKKPHLTIWKDFPAQMMFAFSSPKFQGYYRFSTQPNMAFTIPTGWLNETDYVGALHKKYRDQYKRARKKASALTKRQLDLAEIEAFATRIHELYHHVAANAPFNTFYLHENHFIELKRALAEDFLVYGYFDGENLVGFNTIIRNGGDIDTYFLGYDERAQRECMLYLNMLYDMLGYSIKHGFKRIIFARTALEIKSSIGAKPEPMYGLIRHGNAALNSQIHRLFRYFEPQLSWTQRHPFKDGEPQLSSASAGSRSQDG